MTRSKERLYRALLADTHDLHTNGYYGSSVWGCGTTDVAMPSVNRLAKSIRPMYPVVTIPHSTHSVNQPIKIMQIFSLVLVYQVSSIALIDHGIQHRISTN